MPCNSNLVEHEAVSEFRTLGGMAWALRHTLASSALLVLLVGVSVVAEVVSANFAALVIVVLAFTVRFASENSAETVIDEGEASEKPKQK